MVSFGGLLGSATTVAGRNAGGVSSTVAAKQGIGAGVTVAGKTDLSELIAKNAPVKPVTGDVAAVAGKGAAADSAEVLAKNATADGGEVLAKNATADGAQVAAKNSTKEAAQAAAKDTGKGISRKTAIAAAGAAALLAGGAILLGTSTAAADKSNNTPRNIVDVKADPEDSEVLIITFEPDIKILISDAIVVTGSQTTPSIDGAPTIVDALNSSQISVLNDNNVTEFKAGGSIQVTTTVADQAADAAGTLTGAATSIVGSAAAGATGGLFKGIFGPGGLTGFLKKYKIYFIIFCACILALVAYGIYRQVTG